MQKNRLKKLKPYWQRIYAIYRLVRARRKLVLTVQLMRKNMRRYFDRWQYKYRDYERFQIFFKILRGFQRDFKIKMLRRRVRIYFQQQTLISETIDIIKSRLDFKRVIKKVTFVQKHFRWIRFIRLIRFAKSIKEILWEHFDGTVWPEIRGIIQVRSCIKIQKTVRGHLVRNKYAEERTHLRIFRINLFQNMCVKKIQKFYKGFQVRHKLMHMKAAAVIIQKNYRGYTYRRLYRHIKSETIKIQVLNG